MNKKYKCGLYVGRFQPLHMGHTSIMMRMFRECDMVIIAIGSAQQCGTKKNPFSYALRANMIRALFRETFPRANNVYIIPMDDREHPSNDPSWGSYLISRTKVYTGLVPDVIYEGEEAERNNWYDNLDIPVERVSREAITTTGTRVRECLLNDEHANFNFHVPYPVIPFYDQLRKELLKCYNLPET